MAGYLSLVLMDLEVLSKAVAYPLQDMDLFNLAVKNH